MFYGGLCFEPILPSDVELLSPLMKAAFDADSMLHLGRPGGPEGYDDGSFLRKYALSPQATSYTISRDGVLIGGIILWIHPDTGENFLGNIFIAPTEENRGVGTLVWEFVEKQFPDTLVWRTETPIFSHRNHHFYVNKCGFHVVKIENPKDWEEGSFLLEKQMAK